LSTLWYVCGLVKCKVLSKQSVAEVKETVKLWLCYASARSGGRNNWRGKAQALPPTVVQQQSDTDTV